MNKIIITLYTIMILLMIMPQALATEYSVNLDLDTNYIRLGPTAATMIKATVENTGEQTDTYTISPQNNWIITAPQKVTLNPGEIKSIAIFMTPPQDIEPMEYTKDITVESGNSKDTETITIDVLRVHGVELDTTTLRTTCIGDTETFDIYISNIGLATETYSITSTSGILEKDEITVESEETEKVTLMVPVTTEEQTIDVTVKSTTSYAEDSKTLQILAASCYSQAASITPESKTMCIKESSDFTITVRNTGTKEDTYTVTTDFGELSSQTLIIDAQSETKVKLTVSPEDMGQYTASIKVASAHETTELQVTINAQSCKGIAVIITPKEKIVCKGENAQYSVTLKNIGKTEDTLALSTTMGELSETEITIEAGDTAEVLLTIQTEDLSYDTYTVEVTAESDIQDSSKSTLTVENCYSGTLSVEPQIMTVCPKRDATFTITLENTGKNKDTYTLETSDGTLEKDTVELESQKTGDIQLTVPANTEEKEVIINMFSEHTQETKTVTVSLKDEEKCYGFTVNANPGIIEANEYKGYLYTITVKNTGEYASEFSISPIGGPEWTYIDPTTQNIETGSEQQFFIYVSPPYGTEVGTYNIDIEVKRDNITTKTTTLKLILGKTATQETPSEKEDEPSIEEEPEEELPKTYPLTTDTEKTYEISENDTLTIESSYTKDNKETEVIINIRTGSFIIEIDDALIEDEEPELGENTYELTTEEKQYTITIEFTEVNATSNTYKFKVKDMHVTELKDETQDTPTGKVTDEQTSGVPKDIIYATIIGLIIIILILFGPEIAEKTKNFFTEEVEEKKDEEDKEDDWTPATLHKEDQIPLDEIKGIGDKRKDALRKSGIESANDLAEASISDIMAEAVTSEKQAKNLIRKAKLLVKKKAKEQEAKEEPKEKPKPKAKKPKKSKPRKEVKEDIKDILESI